MSKDKSYVIPVGTIAVLAVLAIMYSFGQERSITEDWTTFNTFLESPFEWQGWHYVLIVVLLFLKGD